MFDPFVLSTEGENYFVNRQTVSVGWQEVDGVNVNELNYYNMHSALASESFGLTLS